MEHMHKKEYIQKITALLKETDDEVLMEFIMKMLMKSTSLDKAS